MKFTLEHISKFKWVELENGNKKKLTILKDVSFEAGGKCIHAIVGPSGSGKTTILRLLNKLESPEQGRILLDGIDITNIPARTLRKDVGMVFQVPALFKGNIEDNILFGPRLNKPVNPVQDVKKLLQIVGLKNVELTREIDNLSIGQQQRVSFARALANKPKMLLLDEPTSALDPSAANNFLDLAKKIHLKMGINIIIVTHILHHAQRIADSVCLLAEGEIVEQGPAKEFFEKPKTEVGQKFVRGEL